MKLCVLVSDVANGIVPPWLPSRTAPPRRALTRRPWAPPLHVAGAVTVTPTRKRAVSVAPCVQAFWASGMVTAVPNVAVFAGTVTSPAGLLARTRVAAPLTPAVPAVPSAPSVPGAPGVPGSPFTPGEPAGPAAPVAPVAPLAPVAPMAPVA